MKKLYALILVLALSLPLTACGKSAAQPSTSPTAEALQLSSAPVELTVFAAASMTETLNQVIELYKSAAPNVKITPTYDSSGTLMTQITEGAECDLFISAALKQMNALDAAQGAEKNPDKLDFIASDTRVNLLENKVVLVVPKGNPAKLTKFADISKAKLIALGNSDVPVGSYSLDIIKYLGMDIAALENAGKITYDSNVKEVTTQVAEGTVDCGIVYATDANVAGLDIVDTAMADMCKKVVYPAAVLKASKYPEAARAFLDFLKTDEAMSVFEKVGFTKAE